MWRIHSVVPKHPGGVHQDHKCLTYLVAPISSRSRCRLKPEAFPPALNCIPSCPAWTLSLKASVKKSSAMAASAAVGTTPMLQLVDMEENDPRLVLDLYPVIKELRSTLESEEKLLHIYKQGYPQGLRFTGAYLANQDQTLGECVGVAGWRIVWVLFAEKKLYVDDLVTKSTARSTGVGRALMGYLEDKARQEGCTRLDLDSGTHRMQAHKFYFREGLTIDSFHFSKTF